MLTLMSLSIEKGWEKTTEGFGLDEQLLDKDAEEEFLLRVAINELKLSENDDQIVENEKLNENIGDNDVEEIEPEMANEEKSQKDH